MIELSIQVTELTKDRANLKESLDKYEEEMVELSVQVAELQATGKTLFYENDLLDKKINEVPMYDSKGKSERSQMKFQLEEELGRTKIDLTTSLERNAKLDRKLVQVKAEAEKDLRWTTSS